MRQKKLYLTGNHDTCLFSQGRLQDDRAGQQRQRLVARQVLRRGRLLPLDVRDPAFAGRKAVAGPAGRPGHARRHHHRAHQATQGPGQSRSYKLSIRIDPAYVESEKDAKTSL